MTQVEELQTQLLLRHFVSAREGTLNLLFQFAALQPSLDRQRSLPANIVKALNLPTGIKNFFDYRSQFAGVYNRMYQMCIVSLCSDIEKLFRELFQHLNLTPGKGRGFYQRFDEVIGVLAQASFDFSGIQTQCDTLSLAFQIRHISIHNLGEVDQDFIDKTEYKGEVGEAYQLGESDFLQVFKAFSDFVATLDKQLHEMPFTEQ